MILGRHLWATEETVSIATAVSEHFVTKQSRKLILKVTVTHLMIFIAVTNVVAITRRYYKLFTKNLVLYKYLSFDIIRFAFYSGIRRATRLKFFKALQFYAFKHAIISAKRCLVIGILRF